MKSRLAFLLLFFLIVPIHATSPPCPITIEITWAEGALHYTVNRKPMDASQILAYLNTQGSYFGPDLPCDILIADSVPLAALLQAHKIVKDSELQGEIHFYLLAPRVEGRDEHGKNIVNNRAMHELKISPFPCSPPEPVSPPIYVFPPELLVLPPQK
jgi:hypothetical protein